MVIRTHDPLVHRDTDKVRFYKGDWRATRPTDFKPAQLQPPKDTPQKGHTPNDNLNPD